MASKWAQKRNGKQVKFYVPHHIHEGFKRITTKGTMTRRLIWYMEKDIELYNINARLERKAMAKYEQRRINKKVTEIEESAG